MMEVYNVISTSTLIDCYRPNILNQAGFWNLIFAMSVTTG